MYCAAADENFIRQLFYTDKNTLLLCTLLYECKLKALLGKRRESELRDSVITLSRREGHIPTSLKTTQRKSTEPEQPRPK